MTDLPAEIQVWHSNDKLCHTGTWATERYPAEAVTYVRKADAQAAMAMVVERCAEELERAAHEGGLAECCGFGVGGLASPPECCGDPDYMISARHGAAAIRALAPIDGLALVQELRAESETRHQLHLEQVRITNEWIAERDRLAAANAVLEAKVAGLRDLLERGAMHVSLSLRAWHGEVRAALATQEAGNAQSTPPISPEEAQFNAIRYHERFGPLDEKGNPLDPRRRG